MKGCELDTDGDGNCPIHPKGCPREIVIGVDMASGKDVVTHIVPGVPDLHGDIIEASALDAALQDWTPTKGANPIVGKTNRNWDNSTETVDFPIVEDEPMYGGHIDRPGADRTGHRTRIIPESISISLVDKDKAPPSCEVHIIESERRVPRENGPTRQPNVRRDINPLLEVVRPKRYQDLMANAWPANPAAQLGGSMSFRDQLVVYINIEDMDDVQFHDVLDRALALRPNDRALLRFNVLTEPTPLTQAIVNAGFDPLKDSPEHVIETLSARIKAVTDTYKLDTCAHGVRCQDSGCRLLHR